MSLRLNKSIMNPAASSGFSITFPNGWSVSVQWAGPYFYNSNSLTRDGSTTVDSHAPCEDAEIAVIHSSGIWYSLNEDCIGEDTYVRGSVTAIELVAILDKVSKL